MGKDWTEEEYDQLFQIVAADPKGQRTVKEVAKELGRNWTSVSIPLRLFRAYWEAANRSRELELLRIPTDSPPKLSSPILNRSLGPVHFAVNSMAMEKEQVPQGDPYVFERVCSEIKASAEREIAELRALQVKVDAAQGKRRSVRTVIAEKEKELAELKEKLQKVKTEEEGNIQQYQERAKQLYQKAKQTE